MKMKSILTILALLIIMLAGTVWGAFEPGFITPTNDSTIRGTAYNFNVTTNVSLSNVTSCNITGSSALSGDSLVAGELTLINDTGADETNMTNRTYDLRNLNDATDWTFTATCVNSTVNQAVKTWVVTGVTVDMTSPVVDTPTPATNTVIKSGGTTLSVVCSNATNSIAPVLNIFGQTYTMDKTAGATNCSYLIGYMGNGNWPWTVTATDGLNSTTSDTFFIEKRKSGGLVGGGAKAVEVVTTTTTATPAAGIPGKLSSLKDNKMLLVVIGIVAFMWLQGGKKGRKR